MYSTPFGVKRKQMYDRMEMEHHVLDGVNGYLHDPTTLPLMKQPSLLTEFEEG
jgi:hypothetical protein